MLCLRGAAADPMFLMLTTPFRDRRFIRRCNSAPSQTELWNLGFDKTDYRAPLPIPVSLFFFLFRVAAALYKTSLVQVHPLLTDYMGRLLA